MINYAAIISPEFVKELYEQGFRPPTKALSGQVWYDPMTKYYWRFEDGDKATQFSNKGHIVDMDLPIPEDLTKLFYSPSEFELNEYLSDWICTEHKKGFICQNKKYGQEQGYFEATKVDALAKTWIGERNRRLSFKICQQLKEKGFPQPKLALGTFWYDDMGVIVKVDLLLAKENQTIAMFRFDESSYSWNLITGYNPFDKNKACFVPSVWSVLHELKAQENAVPAKPLTENYTLDECVERWLEGRK